MQLDNSLIPSILIAAAFVIQFGWAWIVKTGQTDYARDLYYFRRPSTIFSRYFSWRISRFMAAVMDTAIINAISLGAIIYFGIIVLGPFVIYQMLWLIILLAGITVVSSSQILMRLYKSRNIEKAITEQLDQAIDKIGEAKKIVNHYIQTGELKKLVIWFALYRIAQAQNTVGWSIRDVLLEIKDRDLDDLRDSSTLSSTDDKVGGPQIEALWLRAYM